MSPLFIKRSCRRKRHGWRTFLSIYYYNFGRMFFKTTTFFNIYYIINLIKFNSKIKSLSVIQLLHNNKLSLFKNSTLIFLFYYFPRCWKCQVSRKGLTTIIRKKTLITRPLEKDVPQLVNLKTDPDPSSISFNSKTYDFRLSLFHYYPYPILK